MRSPHFSYPLFYHNFLKNPKIQYVYTKSLGQNLISYSSKIKFKPRQRRLTVYMLLTTSGPSATSKQCFELTSSVPSTTSKQCFELTTSVLFTTSKQCFEQPAASFLVCSLIFIEYQEQPK